MYFPITKQNEHPNFVEVKGHKYLSFFHFPKIRAGKSVKQVNKIELPNQQNNPEAYGLNFNGIPWPAQVLRTVRTSSLQ